MRSVYFGSGRGVVPRVRGSNSGAGRLPDWRMRRRRQPIFRLANQPSRRSGQFPSTAGTSGRRRRRRKRKRGQETGANALFQRLLFFFFCFLFDPPQSPPVAPTWERQRVFLTASHSEPLCPPARLVTICRDSHPSRGIRSLGDDPSSTGSPTCHVRPRLLVRVLCLRNESHVHPLRSPRQPRNRKSGSDGLGVLGACPNDIGDIWTTSQ